MSYNIRNPLDEWEKEQKRMHKAIQDNLKQLHGTLVYDDEESPMDHVHKIEEQFKKTIIGLENMEEILKAQSESVKSISESALVQAESAKTIAEKARIEIESLTDKSLSSKIKANKAFAVSVISLLITILINLEKIINGIKVIVSYLH